MRAIKVLFMTILICRICATAYGQDGLDTTDSGAIVIDIAMAVDMAIKTSELVEQSGNNVKKAGEILKETNAAWKPHVDGAFTWTNNARYPVNARYERGAVGDYKVDTGLEASQVLWTFGKISNAIAAAKEGVDVNKYLEEANRLDAEYSGKMAFYNLLLADNIYRIICGSYANAVENKRILEERSSAGRVSRKDNIDIEADIASRSTLVNDAKSDKKVAENTLKRVLGIEDAGSVELKIDPGMGFSEINKEEMVDKLLRVEPSIKALDSKARSFEDLVRASKAEYYPTIAAFGSWTYAGQSDSAKKAYIGNKDQMDQFGIMGVKVDVPIWEGGARQARLNQARLDKENADLDLKKARKDLVLALGNAISEYNEYIKTLEANNKAVDLAERTFSLFQELFSSGQVSLLELNDAELMLTNERLKREATIYGIKATKAEIDRLTSVRI
ncbi:MAG: TolC family protein [Candidatus Omnitrophica bacterium]|nr:TolC family protein [Candidatus Omnitrophota bacterium]